MYELITKTSKENAIYEEKKPLLFEFLCSYSKISISGAYFYDLTIVKIKQ
jgi:hypothetical protein